MSRDVFELWEFVRLEPVVANEADLLVATYLDRVYRIISSADGRGEKLQKIEARRQALLGALEALCDLKVKGDKQ